MSKIEFGQNCPLTLYLLEVSMFDDVDCKARFAADLVFGLGYPRFNQNSANIAFTADLLRSIAMAEQTALMSEANERCVNCPQSSSCEVGTLFING